MEIPVTYRLSPMDMERLINEMGKKIRAAMSPCPIKIYGIPRGGIHIAYLLKEAFSLSFEVVHSPEEAHCFVDDIVDSGKTRQRFLKKYGKIFFGMIEKSVERPDSRWYIFPWEVNEEGSAEDIVTRTLQFIGEDVTRDGLLDTPRRVIKAWQELYSGYKMDAKAILSKQFENETKYDQMVISRNIDFYSMCEHHMLPFYGQAHIAYLPKDKIVGISKLARLVECFSRRLQVQERMTQQIADSIQDALDPLGCAVYVEGQHLCQQARGIQKQNAVMVTSALKGVFKNEAPRLEFILLSQAHK